MTLQTWVARFVVDHGRVTEEGGRLRTFQRRRLDEPEVDLHVLGEPAGAKGDELGSQALEAIGRLFLQDRLSLTGGLLKALRSTHQTLLDWNRRSVPRDQVSLGVVAAVVNGNVVYVAQTGPGVVFHRRDGRLYRYVADAVAGSPLGEGTAEPDLRRFEMQPGELLLVASGTLETIVDRDLLDSLLERGSDQALPELYLMTRDLPNFALFLITCIDAAEDEEPFAALQATTPAPPPVATPPAPAQPTLVRATPVSEHDPYATTALSTRAPPEPLRRRSTGRFLSATEPELDAGGGGVAVLTAPEPLDISRPVVRLRNDAAPNRTDYARTTGSASRLRLNLAQRRLAIVGAAVAVIILLGIVVVPDLIRQNRSSKVATLVANAQSQYALATGETDAARKRSELDDTRRLVTEALRLDGGNATAADLQKQASSALQQLDALTDLGNLAPLTTLSRQVTGDVSIDGLTVAAGNAYLLDGKGGRVFSVPLAGPTAGTPTVVYQDGETYGGTPAKKPMFLSWDTAGNRLLVLDSERKLFQVAPNAAAQPLALRRTNTWSSVAAIATYDSNLYVLDPKGNQVFRYLPAASGFDSEPTTAVSSNSLAGATNLTVDGDVYVVLKSGQVQRFQNGSDAGYTLGGIDRPPKSITGVSIIDASDDVYLADAGNKRIVVGSRDGKYKRQLVSNSFTDLRALGVDPAGGTLYVAVGDALLAAPTNAGPTAVPPAIPTVTPTAH